ncbi:MAG: FHA domain-containing protein [Dehalococcoidia bacterium]
MQYGTLRVQTPDGQVREYPIDMANVVIGRAEGNGVVIDHVSVSRRHAQLRLDGSKVTIEDLGSANGTFVGSHQLEPSSQATVAEGQPIRFGDVEARFFIPIEAGGSGGVAMGGAGSFTASSDAQATFSVSLASPNGPVAAGATTTATVVVQNRGATLDQFTLSVLDLPASWVRLSRQQLSLVPAARDEVTIAIQPPRTSEAVAGEYAFSVQVISRDNGREVRVLGKLTVLPFDGVAMAVEPRGGGAFWTIVSNTGNAPASYTLGASDDKETLDFTFERDAVELAPGDRETVGLKVVPKKRSLFGNVETRPFRVQARPRGAGTQQAASEGQIAIRPPLRYWKWVAAAVLLVAVVGLGAWAATKIDFGGDGDGKPADATAEPSATASTGIETPTPAPTVLARGTTAIVLNSAPPNDCLNVRIEPKLTSSSVTKLCNGDKVKITSDRVEADGFYWWSVEKDANTRGWSAERRIDGSGVPFLQLAP